MVCAEPGIPVQGLGRDCNNNNLIIQHCIILSMIKILRPGPAGFLYMEVIANDIIEI